MYAGIIISNNIVDQTYEYYVPQKYEDFIKLGSRVQINFGLGSREVMGFVVELYEEPKYDGVIKEITNLLDYNPLISLEQLKLAEFISQDTVCPLGIVLNLMIPKTYKLKSVTYLIIKDYCELDATLAMEFKGKSVIKVTKELDPFMKLIKKEIEKGNAMFSFEAEGYNKEKIIVKYLINKIMLYEKETFIKKDVFEKLLPLIDEEALTKEDFIDKCQITEYYFKKLDNLGIFDKVNVRVSRVISRTIKQTKTYNNVLKEQVELNKKIIQNSKNNKPVLWRPNNEDEIISTLESIIIDNNSKQLTTVIIVPDILSSYKISSILRVNLCLPIACLNSNLSDGEYSDLFSELKDNSYSVIVTTSKCSLLHFNNTATIIMLDVESDNYYNDQSPRYDLKVVMEYFAEILNANLVFESYSANFAEVSKGIKGTYQLLDNYKKDKNIPIETINLRDELLNGNNKSISKRLEKLILMNIYLKKISVLVSTTKEYSSLIMCRSCGHIIKCPRCGIAVKYNKKNNQINCPTCSYKADYSSKCSNCNEDSLLLESFGIEQINEELHQKIPNIRTIVLDNPDYNEYGSLITKAIDNEVDVIITTPNYMRGLELNNINLVGIVNIDKISEAPNLDASHRAYNTLIYANHLIENAEIINELKTKIVVQTFKPDSFYLQTFINNDYDEYIKKEINNRKILRIEPFYRVNRIFVKAPFDVMFLEANSIKKALQEMLPKELFIIGPTYNRTEQAATLVIKHKRQDISLIYQNIIKRFRTQTVSVVIDKYPKYL